MLFPYQYVPHQMEKMQAFIDFIFLEVWCRAPGGEPFTLDLFEPSPELLEVMREFYYTDPQTKSAIFFYGHVERIYGSFSSLTSHQIDQLKHWYQGNNDIERVCANDPTAHIARYADIRAEHDELSDHLAVFFKGLYSRELLNAAALRRKIGDIDDHYQNFMQSNPIGKCPFCGIGDIKRIHHSKREAYDHYLPKAHYPFNSINFRNLAPTCHECNSSYKTTKDPVCTAAGRRKSFYPYSNSAHNIEVSIDLGSSDIAQLDPADIQLSWGPVAIHEEIETWKDVYGIEERYKAKCCSSDAKDWIEQIRILYDACGMEPGTSLTTVQQQAENAPFANSNFLKNAFLEGCDRAGVFDGLVEGEGTP